MSGGKKIACRRAVRSTFTAKQTPFTQMSVTTKPLIVSIEGNIGSGKSTLLRRLRELKPEWMFVDEPVDSWMSIRNDSGESLLEVFYKDIKRWAYTFQNAAVLSRGMMVREAFERWQAGNIDQRQKVIFMERCVETDKNVFAKMLKTFLSFTVVEKNY